MQDFVSIPLAESYEIKFLNCLCSKSQNLMLCSSFFRRLQRFESRDANVMEKSSIVDFSNWLDEANVKVFHNFIIFLVVRQMKNKLEFNNYYCVPTVEFGSN